MRAIAAGSRVGPTSLTTMRRNGVPCCAASPMPISPPIEVPTQSTVFAFSRASSVTMSATYCGTW